MRAKVQDASFREALDTLLRASRTPLTYRVENRTHIIRSRDE